MVIETDAIQKLGAVSYSPSIVTMALSCILRDKARYWSKIVIIHTPLHSAPLLGESRSENCHPIWCGNTRMVGLRDGEKN